MRSLAIAIVRFIYQRHWIEGFSYKDGGRDIVFSWGSELSKIRKELLDNE